MNTFVKLTHDNRIEYIIGNEEKIEQSSNDGMIAFQAPPHAEVLPNWAEGINRMENGYTAQVFEALAIHKDRGPDCAYRKAYANTAETPSQWQTLMREAYDVPHTVVWTEEEVYLLPEKQNQWPVMIIQRTIKE